MSKYICVFCDERKESDTAHLINGKIGICRHCFENLDKTAYASPYQGTEHIAFTMSPFEYTKSMRKVILDKILKLQSLCKITCRYDEKLS